MESEKLNGVTSTPEMKDLDKNNSITPSKAKDTKNGKLYVIIFMQDLLNTQILLDSSHSHKKKKSKDKDREKVNTK